MTPPVLKTCRSRIGSSTGSSSSPTPSSSAGLPNCTAFSSERRKSESLSLNEISAALASLTSRWRCICLIHLFACICGSTISGQRRAYDVMMPCASRATHRGPLSV